MSQLSLQATETAEWHTLVDEAVHRSTQQLHEELQSYLVFMLMRHTRHAELASQIMSQTYLQSAHLPTHEQQSVLRDVGDSCLLLSGLFPERAARLRLRVGYFVDIGQSAYHVLGGSAKWMPADLFQRLAAEFVSLMDVLHAMRDLQSPDASWMTPLQALEIWQDTGSLYAHNVLAQYDSLQTILLTNTLENKN